MRIFRAVLPVTSIYLHTIFNKSYTIHNASLNITISLRQRPIVIHNPRNLHFLPFPRSFISLLIHHNYLKSISLPWAALNSCIGWTLVYKEGNNRPFLLCMPRICPSSTNKMTYTKTLFYADTCYFFCILFCNSVSHNVLCVPIAILKLIHKVGQCCCSSSRDVVLLYALFGLL